jgi:phosphate-selective porin OprO/OprP
VYSNIDYQLEVDFAGKESNAFNSPAFYDTYLQIHGLPSLGGETGRLRVGHFREPFSLEELSSLPRLTFLERSLADVFAPSRNVGIQWSDALLGDPGKERLTYAVGVFKASNTFATSSARGYSVTGRITGLPWYENDGEHLLHLGAAFSHREPNGAVLGWNARPESRLTQFRYANADSTVTGFRLRDARVETVDEAGFEAALVYGPFSLQGEYEFADVSTTFDGDRSFSGYYAQAGYFLTGEHRGYRNAEGVFDRVRPKHNFDLHGGGLGAWEVALRYSNVDLNDGAVRGGQQDNITAGVSWYINPNARLTLNYIYNDVNHDLYKGSLDTVQARFGVDF